MLKYRQRSHRHGERKRQLINIMSATYCIEHDSPVARELNRRMIDMLGDDQAECAEFRPPVWITQKWAIPNLLRKGLRRAIPTSSMDYAEVGDSTFVAERITQGDSDLQ